MKWYYTILLDICVCTGSCNIYWFKEGTVLMLYALSPLDTPPEFSLYYQISFSLLDLLTKGHVSFDHHFTSTIHPSLVCHHWLFIIFFIFSLKTGQPNGTNLGREMVPEMRRFWLEIEIYPPWKGESRGKI